VEEIPELNVVQAIVRIRRGKVPVMRLTLGFEGGGGYESYISAQGGTPRGHYVFLLQKGHAVAGGNGDGGAVEIPSAEPLPLLSLMQSGGGECGGGEGAGHDCEHLPAGGEEPGREVK